MGARRRSGRLAAVAAAVAVAGLVTTGVTAGGAVGAPGRTVATADSGVAGKGSIGTWRVQDLGTDRYRVSWTSPTRFPMTSDRPTIVGLDGIATAPTIADDGRTVSVIVTATTRPDADDLDVMLSGDRLDHTGDDRRRVGASVAETLDLPDTKTLASDPGTPGPYDVVSSDYELDPIQLDGMKEPIEMVGHVVEPTEAAATGPRPLVLFLHGRHGVCYRPGHPNAYSDAWPCQAPFKEIPSQLGYDYIQQVLASQGYATVSIRANGINAQDYALDDGGADARAELVEAHLDHWATIAAAHQVDLDRVVLIGHSRGGEGVDRASIQIPLSAPYRVVGQVLIAPTDFATQTAPYIPTVTLLPACDGDVSDLQGQRFTDTARDIAADDTSLKSSVLVMGANHNFFNTEWTPDIAQAPSGDDWYGNPTKECGADNPERLTAQGQQDVGLAYVAGAVHLFASDEQDLLPLFDGSRARVASQGAAQTLSHAIGGGRDVRRPDLDTALSLADGAQTSFCEGQQQTTKISSCTYGVSYTTVAPHWPSSYERVPLRPEFEMTWTAVGQSGGLVLDDPLDLSSGRLDLRAIVDPKVTDTDVDVRITDADGASAVLTPVGGGALPALGGTRSTRKFWAQTIEVDPATLQGASGVDLTRITQVDLVARSAKGRLWVVDLAAALDTLTAVPATRVPTVNLSSLVIDEGDDPGQQIARLPFEVVGEVTRPARLSVVTTSDRKGTVQRFSVDLAPGQTSGSIPIGYVGNKRSDYKRMVTQVTAWATRNVMTDNYLGSLTIRDDDPSPTVRLTPVRKRVTEGQPAVWRLRLSSWVAYSLSVNGRVVRGPAPTVSVGDIAPGWVSSHLGAPDLTTPLWKAYATTWDQLPRGSRTLDISIPTRRDRLTEQPESITLRVKVLGSKLTRTIKVVDPGPAKG